MSAPLTLHDVGFALPGADEKVRHHELGDFSDKMNDYLCHHEQYAAWQVMEQYSAGVARGGCVTCVRLGTTAERGHAGGDADMRTWYCS